MKSPYQFSCHDQVSAELLIHVLLFLLIAANNMNSIVVAIIRLVLNPVAHKRDTIPSQIHNVHGQVLAASRGRVELNFATESRDAAHLDKGHELVAIAPCGFRFAGD